MKILKPRIIDTCFGEFIIEGNLLSKECIARSTMDKDLYYPIPHGLNDEEIKSLFEELKEFEK